MKNLPKAPNHGGQNSRFVLQLFLLGKLTIFEKLNGTPVLHFNHFLVLQVYGYILSREKHQQKAL